MLQIAIVVFREVLEIALILGILASATKEIKGRTNYILIGLALGIAIAIGLAFFTDQISNSLDGMGQEEGKKPLYTLLIVVLLSVVREGTEIVLFTYSYFISGTKFIHLFLGLVLGITLGLIAGIALYLGILKAFGKYFFMVSSWLLVFFASGIASLGIGYWQNAGIIGKVDFRVIDLSSFISQQHWFGKFLNLFFGYIDHPSILQLVVYFSTLTFLSISLKIAKKI